MRVWIWWIATFTTAYIMDFQKWNTFLIFTLYVVLFLSEFPVVKIDPLYLSNNSVFIRALFFFLYTTATPSWRNGYHYTVCKDSKGKNFENINISKCSIILITAHSLQFSTQKSYSFVSRVTVSQCNNFLHK